VFTRIDQSIAMAALFSAFHLKVKAIATLTQSGSTSLWMSRLNSGVPIYALTPEVRTRYKLSMYRGVTPLMIKLDPDADRDRMLIDAEAELLRSGAVKVGDLIVLSFGEPIGVPGGTNTLKIVKGRGVSSTFRRHLISARRIFMPHGVHASAARPRRRKRLRHSRVQRQQPRTGTGGDERSARGRRAGHPSGQRRCPQIRRRAASSST
jgi:hypothetical protein